MQETLGVALARQTGRGQASFKKIEGNTSIVTLAEVKDYLRISNNLEDTLLESFIAAAENALIGPGSITEKYFSPAVVKCVISWPGTVLNYNTKARSSLHWLKTAGGTIGPIRGGKVVKQVVETGLNITEIAPSHFAAIGYGNKTGVIISEFVKTAIEEAEKNCLSNWIEIDFESGEPLSPVFKMLVLQGIGNLYVNRGADIEAVLNFRHPSNISLIRTWVPMS